MIHRVKRTPLAGQVLITNVNTEHRSLVQVEALRDTQTQTRFRHKNIKISNWYRNIKETVIFLVIKI